MSLDQTSLSITALVATVTQKLLCRTESLDLRHEIGNLTRRIKVLTAKPPTVKSAYGDKKRSGPARDAVLTLMEISVLQDELNDLKHVSAAVDWSIQAWRALYTAITVRSSSSAYGLLDNPCERFVTKLSLLCLTVHHNDKTFIFGERAVSFMKQSLAFVAAKAFKQTELGEVDDVAISSTGRKLPGLLAGGWVGRRLNSIMHGSCFTDPKQLRLGLDILMSKIGCAPSFPELVTKAYQGHRDALCIKHPVPLGACLTGSVKPPSQETGATQSDLGTRLEIPHCLPDEQIARAAQIRERTILNIRKTVHHCFGGKTLNVYEGMPSLHAGYEAQCLHGGAFGKLLRSFLDEEWSSERCGMGDTYDSSVRIAAQPSLLQRMSYDVKQACVREDRLVPVPQVGTGLLRRFQLFVDKQAKLELSSNLYTKPSAVLEPLKCRMVTAGPPACYYRALELQKFLHHTIKEYAPFTFIGRPCEDSDFNEQFPYKISDTHFISGDYKAATDNLDPELSEAVWDAVCAECDCILYKQGEFVNGELEIKVGRQPLFLSIWKELGKRCLTGHALDYTGLFPEGKIYKQKWGQLMGSPMSFPILCIVNFAATCTGLGLDPHSILSVMKHRREVPLNADLESSHELFCRQPITSIFVNGDDICFQASDDQYSYWKESVTLAGLTPSIGKNYSSDQFMMINSEMRRISHESEAGRLEWVHEGYVNLSLLWGYEKKGPNAGKDVRSSMNWRELGARATALIKGLHSDASHVLEIFIHNHREILGQVPSGISWFLPRSLLGVGLPCLDERCLEKITEDNLRVAAWYSCLDSTKQERLRHYVSLDDVSPLAVLAKEIENGVADILGGKIQVPREWNRNKRGPLGNAYVLAEILNRIMTGQINVASVGWARMFSDKSENDACASDQVLDFVKTMYSAADYDWFRNASSHLPLQQDDAAGHGPARRPTVLNQGDRFKELEIQRQHQDRYLTHQLLRAYKSGLSPMNREKAVHYIDSMMWVTPWERVTMDKSSRFLDRSDDTPLYVQTQ